MIINSVTTPKKMPINRQVITIIKAMAVPSGIPLATNTSTMGTMPAALAYIGTASTTAKGTPHQFSAERYCSKNPSGT